MANLAVAGEIEFGGSSGFQVRRLKTFTYPIRLLSRLSETTLLVAIPIKSGVNCGLHAGVHRGGSSKIPPTFVGHRLSQVARSAASMHRLALGRQSEPLLCSLVGFDFALAFAHRSDLIRFSVNLVRISL